MEHAKKISKKYCPRFGMVAVEMGFITETQLIQALGYQVFEEFQGFGHRLLGAILFDKGWMTSEELDCVATELFRRMRQDTSESLLVPPPLPAELRL